MKRGTLIIWIVVVLLAITASGWFLLYGSRKQTDLQRAKIAYNAGQYSKAVELADKYIAKEPADYNGYLILARCFVHLGKYREAQLNFEIAEQIQPLSIDALSDHARSYTLEALEVIKSSQPENRIEALLKAQQLVNYCDELLKKAVPDTEYKELIIQRFIASDKMYHSRILMQLEKEYVNKAMILSSGRAKDQYGRISEKLNIVRKENEINAQQAYDGLLKSAVNIKAWLDENKNDTEYPIMSSHATAAAEQLVSLLRDRNEIEKLRELEPEILQFKDIAPAAVCSAEITLLAEETFINEKLRDEAVNEKLTLVNSMLEKLSPPHSDWIDISLAKAKLLLTRGMVGDAEKICENILSEKPNHQDARFVYAQSLIARKDFQKALGILFVLKNELGASSDVSMLFANLAMSCGQMPLALQTVNDIVKYDPAYIPSRRFLIKYHIQEHQPSLAFLQAVEYWQYHHESPDALKTLALCSILHDRKLELQHAVEQTLSDYPDDTKMRLAAADVYIQTQNPEGAIEIASNLVRKDPNNLQAWQKLVAYLADDPDGAMGVLEKMKEVFPHESVVAEIKLMLKWGLASRAKKLIGELESSGTPIDNNVKLLAALTNLYMKEPEQAKKYLDTMDKTNMTTIPAQKKQAKQQDVELDPLLEKRFKEALSFENDGQFGRAIEIYLELSGCADKRIAATSCNNAAWLLSKEPGGISQATALSQRAFNDFPTNPQFMDTLGWLKFLSGQDTEARAMLRAALELSKRDHNIHSHLGQVEQKLGNEQIAQWHKQEAKYLEENR